MNLFLNFLWIVGMSFLFIYLVNEVYEWYCKYKLMSALLDYDKIHSLSDTAKLIAIHYHLSTNSCINDSEAYNRLSCLKMMLLIKQNDVMNDFLNWFNYREDTREHIVERYAILTMWR